MQSLLKADLVSGVIKYAQHGFMCRSTDCPHCPHSYADDRVACWEYPCTCGLAGLLQQLIPEIQYQQLPYPPPPVHGPPLRETLYYLKPRYRCPYPCPWHRAVPHVAHGPCAYSWCLEKGTEHSSPHRIVHEVSDYAELRAQAAAVYQEVLAAHPEAGIPVPRHGRSARPSYSILRSAHGTANSF